MTGRPLNAAGWLIFFAVMASGCYVGFRVPLFAFLRIPEGLRIVVSIEIVGLAVATTIAVISTTVGFLPTDAQQALLRLFTKDEYPEADSPTPGYARSVNVRP